MRWHSTIHEKTNLNLSTTCSYAAAEKLKGIIGEFENELLLVMRVYFEKPRTTVGWKGLINDPDLVGTYNVNKVRSFVLNVNWK